MRIVSHIDWTLAKMKRHAESEELQRLAKARELIVTAKDGKFNRPLPTGAFEVVSHDDSVDILINEHLAIKPTGNTREDAKDLYVSITDHPSVSAKWIAVTLLTLNG